MDSRPSFETRARARSSGLRSEIYFTTSFVGTTKIFNPTPQCAGKMPLQHRARDRVGLLQIDAPVFQPSSGIRASVTAQRT